MHNAIKIAAVCTALLPFAAFSGNKANPDAIELAPLPMPVQFKADIDKPVDFDASTTVAVDCPDKGATEWLSRHFADWYGADAPKVKLSTLNIKLPTSTEAYAVHADDSGVKIAAHSLAGVRWAA